MSTDLDWLQGMAASIEAIDRYMPEGEEDVRSDDLVRVWILHHILRVGEGAAHVTKATRDRFPEIPWPELVAVRNAMMHTFARASLEDIRELARRSVLPIANAVSNAIGDLMPDVEQPAESELPVLIAELVQRIVDAVRPIRIVLFGSAARGEMRPDSDIDVLVVMPDGVPCRRTAQDLHKQFFGFPLAVDVVVATPSDLRDHGDTVGVVYRDALREGKESMPPDVPYVGTAEEWMHSAEGDLDMARRPPTAKGAYEPLCFHAQQCVEKAIKGVLVKTGTQPPRTHKIESLIGLLPSGIVHPLTFIRAAELTTYAVDARYPRPTQPVTVQEYRSALAIAEAIMEWARQQMLPPSP